MVRDKNSRKSFHVDIVSPEDNIFTGLVQQLFVTGVEGELEILANHAPLLTEIAPGPVWVVKDNYEEEGFVIFGGILEVQPHMTIILADSAVRAKDIDEAAAQAIQEHTQRVIANRSGEMDYAKAHAELAAAAAQLRLIRKLRESLK